MEKVIKKVIYSVAFYEDLKSIYSYGFETFGFEMAEIFQEKILHFASGLSYMFLVYPECRHLETKNTHLQKYNFRKIPYHLSY